MPYCSVHAHHLAIYRAISHAYLVVNMGRSVDADRVSLKSWLEPHGQSCMVRAAWPENDVHAAGLHMYTVHKTEVLIQFHENNQHVSHSSCS